MNSMLKALPYLLFLYLAALHTSMAAMEILGWTIAALAFARNVQSRDFRLLRENRALFLTLGALVLAVFLPLVLEPQIKGVGFQLGHMRWVVLLAGLTLALDLVWSETFARKFVLIWSILLIITGAYGLLQCLTAIDFLRTGKIYLQADGIYKAVGFFSFSLTFAYSIGISTVGVALPALQTRGKAFASIVWLFGALGIVSSMSRGAWIAAGFCVLVYLVFNRPRLVLPSFAVFALFLNVLFYLNAAFEDKILSLVTLHRGGSENIRLNLWQAYWAMFLDHPFFGVGLLEGDQLLPTYFAKLSIQQDFVSHAHNNFLQFLVGAGVFGFTAYSALVVMMLIKAWRLTRSEPAWGWSLFLAQLFLQVGGLTESNFINTAVNHFLVLIFALTLVISGSARLEMDHS